MWILPLLLQTRTVHEHTNQGFTLIDFSTQLEWDIQQIMFFLILQIQLIFIIVPSGATSVNEWFFILSLLSYVCTKSSGLLEQSTTPMGLTCDLQQMISVFKPGAYIFLSLRWEYTSWAVLVFYVQIKKQKEKVWLYSREEKKQESCKSPQHPYLMFCLNSPNAIALKEQPLNYAVKSGSSSLELLHKFLKDTLQARKDWEVYNFTSINTTDKLPVTRKDVTKHNRTGY